MCAGVTKLGYRKWPAVRDRQKSRMAVWKLALFIATAVDMYIDSSYTPVPSLFRLQGFKQYQFVEDPTA
jgi:hypothetical protein